eukprot:sb/3479682/
MIGFPSGIPWNMCCVLNTVVLLQDGKNFYTGKLAELLDSLEFSQLVPRQPTHNRGGTLDLVVCPKEVEEKVNSLEIYPDGTESDHFLVLSELFPGNQAWQHAGPKSCQYLQRLQVSGPSFVYSRRTEPGSYVGGLPGKLDLARDRGIVDTTVPLRRRKKVKKLRPWRDNEEVRQALRLRRCAERAWESNKTPITKKQYNAMKKTFGKVDKEARINYVKADLEESKGDSNGLQRKLNRLLGKSEVVLPETGCDRKLAEDFADFFTEKVEKIRNSVTAQERAYEDVESRADPARSCAFEEFREVSCEEMKRIVKDMADKTCDLDLIPTWMIKECIEVFAPLFTRVINSSLRKAVVPESFQQAFVFPTIKNPNGDRDSLSNYRPVFLALPHNDSIRLVCSYSGEEEQAPTNLTWSYAGAILKQAQLGRYVTSAEVTVTGGTAESAGMYKCYSDSNGVSKNVTVYTYDPPYARTCQSIDLTLFSLSTRTVYHLSSETSPSISLFLSFSLFFSPSLGEGLKEVADVLQSTAWRLSYDITTTGGVSSKKVSVKKGSSETLSFKSPVQPFEIVSYKLLFTEAPTEEALAVATYQSVELTEGVILREGGLVTYTIQNATSHGYYEFTLSFADVSLKRGFFLNVHSAPELVLFHGAPDFIRYDREVEVRLFVKVNGSNLPFISKVLEKVVPRESEPIDITVTLRVHRCPRNESVTKKVPLPLD